jgi:hypothetical protein
LRQTFDRAAAAKERRRTGRRSEGDGETRKEKRNKEKLRLK